MAKKNTENTDTNATQNVDMTFKRKVSPKSFIDKVTALIPENSNMVKFLGENKVSVKVAARINAFKKVTTTYGESIGFNGQFALFHSDGEIERASVAYFPALITDYLYPEVCKMIEDGGSFLEVKFEIGLAPDPKGKTGYQFTFKPDSVPQPDTFLLSY